MITEYIKTSVETHESKIDKLESLMRTMEQAECPVSHIYAPGLYVRKLSMKAGTVAIGHFQKFYHLNIFLKGKVLMVKDDGIKEIMTAPQIFTGKPGRKVGMILEDVEWLNIYPTSEQDVDTLEDTIFDKSEDFEAYKQANTMQAIDYEVDKSDYENMLLELGITDIDIQTDMDKMEYSHLPWGSYKCKLGKSQIEGKGIIATDDIKEGEIIAPALIENKRTIISRYTNHAKVPNAKMIKINDIVVLIALRNISGCRGGLDGEEITTDYRDNIFMKEELQCQE